MLTLEVLVGRLLDEQAPRFLAVVDDWPEFVGHGDTDEDACDDLCDQINAVTWH